MTQVKICGLRDDLSFDTAIEAEADYVGLVFYPKSPRFIETVQAARLARRERGKTKLIGLFVSPERDDVAAVLRSVKLDILQIYGPASAVATVRERFKGPVWRQFGVSSQADFPADDEDADGFVVEAKPPAGATRPGGNGVLADWDLLAGFKPARPWLLAGGLNPDNVAAALARVKAPGVDVSSGVEIAPGEKSPDLIRRFIKAVRRV